MHPRDKLRVEARSAYIAGRETVTEIAARLGVADTTVNRWRRQDGWPSRGQKGRWRPGGAPVVPGEIRAGLIDRLYRAMERTLARLEDQLEQEDSGQAADHERATRMISTLVRSIEKVKELGSEHSGSSTRPGSGGSISAEEADRIRDEIAERITQLQEQYTNQMGNGAADPAAADLDAK